MRIWLVVAVVLVACSSSKPETVATAPLVCMAGSLTYTTALESCEHANALGRQLAKQISSPNATDDFADIVFVSFCFAMQGTASMTYSFDTDLVLAKALDGQGVCHGDLSMLVRK